MNPPGRKVEKLPDSNSVKIKPETALGRKASKLQVKEIIQKFGRGLTPGGQTVKVGLKSDL